MGIFRLILALTLAAGPIIGPAGAGEVAAGRAKAATVCQTCHGLDGKAIVPLAANLSGQRKDYLVIQLRAFRSGQRRHPQMSIVAKMLSDDDIENVATWYSRIKVTVEMPDEKE